MLEKIDFEHILFLDIETVPECESYDLLDEDKQELFALKTLYQRKEDFSAEAFYDRAGIWAEFGKIICISVGFFSIRKGIRCFRVTSFWGDELTILKDFSNLLETHYTSAFHILCGHNIKEFDLPFIARRCVIHQLAIPSKLSFFGKKPWEIPHLDTMELWKFGDYKHYTSLKLLTNVLGIPSPKDDIDGSQVAEVFYTSDGIDRIIRYCEKDVVAVAQVFLRFRGEQLLMDDEIIFV